jgi:SnoaL-like domain
VTVVHQDAAVQALIDHNAIVALCIQYATALDSRNWTLLRDCFVPDVTADYAGVGRIDGYGALEAVCRAALEPLQASQHMLGNHTVRVTGDEAEGTVYFRAQHVRRETPGGDNYIVAGIYTDRFVRRDERWRIAHRKLDVVWSDGNPSVLERGSG